MHLGVGTDIVAVSRVARLISEGGARFLQRWFTPQEVAYCSGKAHPEQHFAGRLAAKEAVFKALGADSQGAVPWRDLAIEDHPHRAPTVRLSGELLELATSLGVDTVRVSLAHCEDYATATAITVGGCEKSS